MKVSIIVAIYNLEKIISNCIESLINQTYQNIEILLINDGSIDGTINVIEKYKKIDNRIKVYNKKNGGLSNVRNFGVNVSSGEYLLFVDGDDTLQLNTVEKLVTQVDENQDIIIFDLKCISEGHIFSLKGLKNVSHEINKNYLISTISAVNKFYKRSFIINNNIQFMEDIYYEDLELMPKLILYNPTIKYINEDLYNYIKRKNSITNTAQYSEKFNDIFKIFDSIRINFQKANLYNKYKDEIEYIYISKFLINGSLRFIPYNKHYDSIYKIIDIIKKEYPHWYKNKYFKLENYRAKILSYLIIFKQFWVIKLYKMVIK